MLGYRNDDGLKEMIIRVYNYIQSNPFPNEWLHEKIELFNIDESKDFGKTPWGKILLEDLEQTLEHAISELDYIYYKMRREPELEKYTNVILEDTNIYQDLLNSIDRWDELYYKFSRNKICKMANG